MNRFLACFIATRSGIIASISSTGPCRTDFILQWNAPLPDPKPSTGGSQAAGGGANRRWRTSEIRGFGTRLESRELSAQDRLTSEQLRTL